MNRLLCGDYKGPSQFTTARPPQGQDAGSTALTRPSSAGGALWAGEVAAPEYDSHLLPREPAHSAQIPVLAKRHLATLPHTA